MKSALEFVVKMLRTLPMTSLSILSRKLHTRKFFQISVPGKTLLLLQQASSLLISKALQFFMLSEAWNPKSVLQLCHCNYGKHTATRFSIASFALVIFNAYNIDLDFYYKLFKIFLLKRGKVAWCMLSCSQPCMPVFSATWEDGCLRPGIPGQPISRLEFG